MNDRLVTVFGGTGFLGRRIVHQAIAAGWNVRVAARRPRPDLLRDMANRAEAVAVDIRNPREVDAAANGVSAIVNAVGLYVQRRDATFDAIHVVAAGHVAAAARRSSARLVHLSGIGVTPHSRSPYVRARALGEERVRTVYSDSIILRPSALFGPGDALLSAMVPMVRRLPVVPLFGDGSSRVQPVHVDDVARAVLAALSLPDAAGTTFELGGPKIFTYRELLEGIAGRLDRSPLFLSVPISLWRLLAILAAPLPGAPITLDQVELVRRDNIARAPRGFADLDIGENTLRDIIDEIGVEHG